MADHKHTGTAEPGRTTTYCTVCGCKIVWAATRQWIRFLPRAPLMAKLTATQETGQ